MHVSAAAVGVVVVVVIKPFWWITILSIDYSIYLATLFLSFLNSFTFPVFFSSITSSESELHVFDWGIYICILQLQTYTNDNNNTVDDFPYTHSSISLHFNEILCSWFHTTLVYRRLTKKIADIVADLKIIKILETSLTSRTIWLRLVEV